MDEGYRQEELREMSMTARALATLLVAATCAVAGVSAAMAQSTPTDQDAIAWATQHYDEVAISVFGSPLAPAGLDRDTVSVVTARIRPASDGEPESQFALTTLTSGDVRALVIRLRSPLHAQLRRLHRDRPNDSPLEIAKRILHDQFVLSAAQWPDGKRAAAAFKDIRTSIALENALVMDPSRYQLWVDAESEQAYFSLLGPSSGEGRHPIIAWIEATRRRLQQAIK
jgi:hypothetical protein